jgi:predicted ferric reductase
MTYKTWRVFHGILALLLVAFAAWHAMDLGRHFNLAMSILIFLLTAGGILYAVVNLPLKYFIIGIN